MMCEYIDMLETRGAEKFKSQGKKDGEAKLSLLLTKLFELGRDDDAKLAVQDMSARDRLYREFFIPNNVHPQPKH